MLLTNNTDKTMVENNVDFKVNGTWLMHLPYYDESKIIRSQLNV